MGAPAKILTNGLKPGFVFWTNDAALKRRSSTELSLATLWQRDSPTNAHRYAVPLPPVFGYGATHSRRGG